MRYKAMEVAFLSAKSCQKKISVFHRREVEEIKFSKKPFFSYKYAVY